MSTISETRRNPMKPNSVLSGLLLIVSIFAVAEVGLLVRDFRSYSEKSNNSIQATISEIHATAKTVNTYTAEQAKVFNSKENRDMQTALRLSAATAIKILRKVERETLPEINSTVAEIRKPLGSLDRAIVDTSRSINADLLPKTAEAIDQTADTLKTLNASIQDASTGANVALADMSAILRNPAIAEALTATAGSAENIEDTTGSIKQAAQELPGIAKDVRKVSDASGKFSKWYWAVKIGVLVKDVFFH